MLNLTRTLSCVAVLSMLLAPSWNLPPAEALTLPPAQLPQPHLTTVPLTSTVGYPRQFLGDAATPYLFGLQTALAGDIFVVGALHGFSVFERNAGSPEAWGKVKTLTTTNDLNLTGHLTLADETLALMCYTSNNNLQACIFERNAGGASNWGFTKALTLNVPSAYTAFAPTAPLAGPPISLDLRGDTLVVGVRDSGALVFERNLGGAGQWGLAKTLLPSETQSGDQFGTAVAVVGDTIVVGAPGYNNTGTSVANGALYIFERHAGGQNNWGETRKMIGSNVYWFGRNLDLDGDTLVVSTQQPAPNVGDVVYVFDRQQGGAGQWGQVQVLTTTAANAAADGLGWALALDQGTLVVGAEFADAQAEDQGAVYIYDQHRNGPNQWGLRLKLLAPSPETDDHFGAAVALDGEFMASGVLYGGDNATDPGAAYLYRQTTFTQVYLPLVRK